MNNHSDQNGRQPPLPAQPRPPARTETENTSSSDEPKQICRNYVWGTCKKSTKCKFRHELDFEEMKKILKFCHDYQNKTGCTRGDCTYLHTTREEENLFLATGEIPRVLAERHAAMQKAATANNGETIRQIAVFIRESYVPPQQNGLPGPMPPSSVPPGATVCAARPAPPLPAPSVHAMSVMPAMPLQIMPLPVQQPPPPPPHPQPPPPPPTASPSDPRPTAPVYIAPLGQPPERTTVVFPMNQPPPPLPVMFDASKPPPPLPNQIKASSVAVKHKAVSLPEAGPSKIRKPGDNNVADAHCENCVQRKIRIDLYCQELDKLQCEQEYQKLLYEKNLEEYKTAKELLRSVVSADLFRILEEHIEGVPQIQDIMSHLNPTSFGSSMSTVPKQFLLQLMDCVLSNPRNVLDMGSSTSSNLDESFLQTLSSVPRRTNSILNHSSPTDVIPAFVDLLQHSKISPDKQQSSDFSNEINRLAGTNGSNGMNGITGCSTSQKMESSTATSMAGSITHSGSVGMSSLAGALMTVPPPPFPSYQPTIPPPPPTGSYYN